MAPSIGLEAIGTYVPRWRLDRATIAASWAGRAGGGARSVANYDEDAITMGAAALESALGAGARDVDGVILATTSAPFAEKSSAVVVAAACDLPHGAFTMDVGSSLRAALSALRSARDAVTAGSARRVAVVAADVRVAEAGTPDEAAFGDAAAAAIVGAQDPLAEILGFGAVSRDLFSRWRVAGSSFVVAEDARYAQLRGQGPDLAEAAQRALAEARIEPATVRRTLLVGAEGKSAAGIAKEIGVPAPAPDSIAERIGSVGTAHPLLALSQALAESEPGDVLLCAAAGDGAEAVVLRATDRAAKSRDRLALSRALGGGRPLSSYARYLRFRGIVPSEGRAGPEVSQVLHREEEQQDVRLYGSRCKKCGTVQYPPARICIQCRARDQMDDHRLAREGVVFTFTRDHLFVAVESPIVMAVVQLADGGRLYGQMTDVDPDTVAVDLPVEIVLRRLHEGSGHPNYFWKARPKI